MAIEQKWPAVAPQLFTSDGTQYGVIKISSASGFKVKQKVVVSAVGQPTLQLQVKRIVATSTLADEDTLIVGPFPTTQSNNTLTARTDLTLYTVANSAYIYAEEQDKSRLKPDDVWAAVYDQEPTVALRTVIVDQYGNYYDNTNPIPIIFDGTVQVGNVTIQDDDGDELEINPDGSINVNIVNAQTANIVKHTYGVASAVAAGIETTIVQYIVPLSLSSGVLQRVSISGENVGRYKVYVNGTAIDTRRTYYGANMSEYFEFSTGTSDGYVLAPGDTVSVTILHSRVYVGDFEGRIQVLENV